MKKKRAFTITELVTALVILGILLVIAIPSYSKLKEKFDNEYNEELEKSVVESAKTYYKDNQKERPQEIGYYDIVNIKELKDKKYIDEKNQSKLKENDWVVIVKNKDTYEYKFCKNGKKDQADECFFNTSDNLKVMYYNNDQEIKFNDLDKIYIHINSYTKEQLKEELKLTKKIVREYKKNNNDMQKEFDLGSIIYPENITSLVINKITEPHLDTTNKLKYQKDVSLLYKFDNKEEQINVVLFQHSDPNYNAGVLTYEEPNSFKNTNSIFIEYEVYNSNKWKPVTCEEQSIKEENNYECKITNQLNGKVKFRIHGKSKDDFKVDQYGKETNPYNINTNNTYIIKFDANGGTGSMSDQECEIGEQCKLNANKFTKTSHEFTGWSLSKEGELIYNDSANVKDITQKGETITLYAVWKNISKYKITYLQNSNSDKVTYMPSAQEKAYNEEIQLSSSIPNRNHYNFIKWNTKADGEGQNYYPSGIYKNNENLKLYAIWEPRTYELTYDNKYGENCNSINKKYNEVWGELCSPNRTGYSFGGWYTGTNGTGTQINSSTIADSNLIVYAKWNLDEYKVTFNYNPYEFDIIFDEKVKTTNVYYNQEYGDSIPNPSIQKENVQFLGWYTDKDKGELITKESIVTTASDHTLYAHWLLFDCSSEKYGWTNKISKIDFNTSLNHFLDASSPPTLLYKKDFNSLEKYNSSYAIEKIIQNKELEVERYEIESEINVDGNDYQNKMCYSKYDSLIPYTPYPRFEVGDELNIGKVEGTCPTIVCNDKITENCYDEASTEPLNCSEKLYIIDPEKKPTHYIGHKDQPSNGISGASGAQIKNLLITYTYSDDTTCTFNYGQNNNCSDATKKIKSYTYVSYDNAGNESKPATFTLEYIYDWEEEQFNDKEK